jgi:hypothetical protein
VSEEHKHSSADNGDDYSDDPASDERWQAGCDYAMMRLCDVLGVEMKAVRWDAATETLDGDVCAVLWNILVAKYGDGFDPSHTFNEGPPAGNGDAIKFLKEAASHITSARYLDAKVSLDRAYNVLIAEPQTLPKRPHSIYSKYHLDNWLDSDFAAHAEATRKTLAYLIDLESALALPRPK